MIKKSHFLFLCLVFLSFVIISGGLTATFPFVKIALCADAQTPDEGDIFVDIDSLDVKPVEQKKLQIGGYVEENIDYSVHQDDPEVSKILTKAGLDARLTLTDTWKSAFKVYGLYDYSYTSRGRDEFSTDVLDAYEKRAEIEELYIDGSPKAWLQLRIGRQIVGWGDTEGDQITDLINSRNQLEPGLLDVEDTRESVTATNISMFRERSRLNVVALHEVRTNRVAPEGSVFDPYRLYREAGIHIADEKEPVTSLENTEYLAHLSRTLDSGDIHVIFADVYDDAPYLHFTEFMSDGTISFTPRHKRIKAYGAYGNYVRGAWLYKTEFALKHGRAIERNDLAAQALQNAENLISYEEKDIIQGMIGVEYSGFSGLFVTFELAGDIVQDHEDYLVKDETSESVTVLLNHEAKHDTLRTDLTWIYYPEDNDSLLKLTTEYDIRDTLTVNAGIVIYESSDAEGLLYPYRKNDRIMAGIKYSF